MTITPAILEYLEGKPLGWSARYILTLLQAEREGHGATVRHAMAIEAAETLTPLEQTPTEIRDRAIITGPTHRNVLYVWEEFLNHWQDSGQPGEAVAPELTLIREGIIRRAFILWTRAGEENPLGAILEQMKGAFAKGPSVDWKKLKPRADIEWVLGGGIRRAKQLRLIGKAMEVFG